MSTPDSDPRVQAARERAVEARDLANRLRAISTDVSTDAGEDAFVADYWADVAGERYDDIWHEVNAELHPDLYADRSDPEAEP